MPCGCDCGEDVEALNVGLITELPHHLATDHLRQVGRVQLNFGAMVVRLDGFGGSGIRNNFV